MIKKLAINGGTPVRSTLFPSQNTIGIAEKEAAARVLDTGKLTGYQGSWGKNFLGGHEVRALEVEWAAKFGVRHAIACNSATSGLFIACGAAGLGYSVDKDGVGRKSGDAIVTPFSMTCSATVPLGWNTGVQFADIERDYYCLNAQSIYTILNRGFAKYSAVIPVSLFGQPYDAEAINLLAHEKGAVVIEDAAQAVGSTLLVEADNPTDDRLKIKIKKYTGTLGDIGVYSFNLGKHLTCGEGGMIVTDNDELAARCRLIMNHAEAVMHGVAAAPKDDTDARLYYNCGRKLFGFNLRLPEISAAIVRVQLAKMDVMIQQRVDNVAYLVNRLKDIPCLEMPAVREGATHTYYVLPIKYKSTGFEDASMAVHRDKFVAAVKAELKPVTDRESEGVTIGAGYIQPIQSMPLFDRSLDETPECRRQWQDELVIIHRMFGPAATRRDLDDIVAAFTKVWENRKELV